MKLCTLYDRLIRNSAGHRGCGIQIRGSDVLGKRALWQQTKRNPQGPLLSTATHCTSEGPGGKQTASSH